MVHRIRSACCFMLMMSRLLTIINGQNRIAKNMTLAFYKEIISSAASDDESKVTEDDWRAYTEWDWKRSLYHQVNETKMYPFLVCDVKQENETTEAMDDRQGYIQVGLGYEFDEKVNFVETIEIVPVVNTENKICVVGSFNSSKAADLPFIVQPISFLMKINIGTADFNKQIDEYDDDSRFEYAVVGCPGLNEAYDEEWWQKALDDFVPWLDWLVESGASNNDMTLLKLKPLLQDDPDYCDEPIRSGVETHIQELPFVVVTLTEDDDRSKQCFQLFAYALAAAPEVCYIERLLPARVDNVDESWIVQSGRPCELPFQDRGLAGKGQVVAVSDTGLDLKSCYFADANVPSTSFFEQEGADNSKRKVVAYVPFSDVTDDIKGHGTHVAGTIAGSKTTDGYNNVTGMADGVAKDAKLAFLDIGMTNGGLKIPDAGLSVLIAAGQNAGAKIHSASWGMARTEYGLREVEIDTITYNTADDDSFLFIVAAGNSGNNGAGSVATPCAAKNTLCVGATEVDNNLEHKRASFSSYGPTSDGRIKPEVVAPGVDVLSAGAESEISCDPDDLPRKGGSRYGLASKSGTSMATPVVSGTAAIIHQYFREGWYVDGTSQKGKGKTISGTLVKAILINGARPMKGRDLNEVDFEQGFGVVSLTHSLPLSGENDMTAVFSDFQILKKQGNVRKYEFNDICKTGSKYEFSVTVAWADVQGIQGGKALLLTDFDLKVTQKSVDGKTTVHFPNGKSRTDKLNNVERVRFIAAREDDISYEVRAAKLLTYLEEAKFSIVAVSHCDGFEPIPEFQTASVCYSNIVAFGDYSGTNSYRIQHVWVSSLSFILFTLGVFQALV